MKNLSHIQYVLPISDYSALAEVYCVHEDLEKVEWKREKFFINKEGKVFAHFEHPSETIRVELLSNEREDLFAVAYGNANGYNIVKILDDGTHKILANYDEIEFGEEDGTFAVQKDGLWGFIDIEGNEIIKPQYDKYQAFYNGVAIVRKDGKRGYINKLGHEITPLKYWHCHPFHDDIAVAENFDYTNEVIDKWGNVLLKSEPYREIFNLGNGSVLDERENQEYEIVKIEVEKLSTGFKAIDNALYGGFPNNLIMLAARPAMGKTSLALNIAQDVFFKEIKATAIFSLEMSKYQLIRRMVSSESELDIQRLKKSDMKRCDWEKLSEIMTKLAKAPLYIDNNAECTIEYIINKCRSLATKEKCLGLIIIDYLELIEGNTAEILSGLKKLAKEINVPILCLSQLSRELEYREDKRPILSDLRGQIIVKNADIIMFLYRDDYYTPSEDTAYSNAEIIIAKNGNSFATSTAKLNFKKNIGKFKDIEN